MPASRPVVQRGPAARIQLLPPPVPKGTPQLSARKSIPETQGRQPGSARERRPTEKENYRRDVIEGTVRRQQGKEMRNDRQARKALRTAYQNNPDEFDGEEPEELFSDVDLEEDTMVSFPCRLYYVMVTNGINSLQIAM
ncbi:hypothetical protein PAXRUDRAFT_163846 [Paxillus rubicundulus Ve08.2h10]|uniref:Uncharacterized protein n=1 Tax=Paxillus rubicundulus Ve08.2h10 TaxID=930991 RepID=A0A0D0DK17_9AGAM|nr:hypothetical protein PAXRUDRAFT_163846 [Paxillus rubicundulus Ve08.2h10]